jgi:hypothetical protein
MTMYPSTEALNAAQGARQEAEHTRQRAADEATARRAVPELKQQLEALATRLDGLPRLSIPASQRLARRIALVGTQLDAIDQDIVREEAGHGVA